MVDYIATDLLDSVLKNFLNHSCIHHILTNSAPSWESISRLTYGYTPIQCRDRYMELIKTSKENGLQLETSDDPIELSNTDEDVQRILTKDVVDGKRLSSEVDLNDNNDASKDTNERSKDNGPMMVIHVCDESKNLKQDFNCPRDILVREMRYFSEYLSSDTHKLEDVDISVHCDITIFDWLIKYVKRNLSATTDQVKLDPFNAVSLLISSDFLKMSTLVEECIEYFHKNMSAILSAPCNMNCINDHLVARIADMFKVDELEDVKDRKDKFKSKLFTKKIEKLFTPGATSVDCPENASTLYRCSQCRKLLTANSSRVITCNTNRVTVDSRGGMLYCHTKDRSFNVNDYVVNLKADAKFWCGVYWRLWGTINYLKCSRCGEFFVCSELGHCRYHPQLPHFDESSNSDGIYLCCQLPAFKYQTVPHNQGCRVRDHIVAVTGSYGDCCDKSSTVYNDLLSHRDLICVPYQSNTDALVHDSTDVFGNEGNVISVGETLLCQLQERISSEDLVEKKSEKFKPGLTAYQVAASQRDVFYNYDDIGCGESDDDFGDEENTKGKKHRMRNRDIKLDHPAVVLDAPGFEQTKKSLWDNQRSMRWNQDSQRLEDHRRMRDIQQFLSNSRIITEKISKQKSKQFVGGLYSKLDNQWKIANTVLFKTPNQPLRIRPRPFQPKPC